MVASAQLRPDPPLCLLRGSHETLHGANPDYASMGVAIHEGLVHPRRRHFHLPDSWLRFLRQHPLSLALAPILFDPSQQAVCRATRIAVCEPAAPRFSRSARRLALSFCAMLWCAVRTCPFLTSVPGPEMRYLGFLSRCECKAALRALARHPSDAKRPGFSQLASAEEPLWGSMTPLLNVSCGPRIFHPTCVDVNMTLG